jgi:S-adenosylmethionine decarboxylase
MNKMGKHCLLNVYGCDSQLLENVDLIISTLKEASEECGATILQCSYHKFEPQGLTAFLLLSESHISIHTYPEHECAAIDIFTCGQADSLRGAQYILKAISPKSHTLTEVDR